MRIRWAAAPGRGVVGLALGLGLGLVAACGTTVSGALPSAGAGLAAGGPGGGPGGMGGSAGGAAVAGPLGSAGVAGARSGGSSPAGLAAAAGPGGAGPGGPAAGSAPGAAAGRGPLVLGMISYSSAAASIGAQSGMTLSVQSMEKALVAQLNASGGIAGRRIVPVYDDLSGTSESYAADLQASCTDFTQDHHVAAVLGQIGIYFEGFVSCLAQHGVPYLDGDPYTGDSGDFSRYPTLVSPDAVSIDRRVVVQLDQLAGHGYVRPSDKIGIILSGCPTYQRAYPRTVQPEIRRLGLDLVGTTTVNCPSGLDATVSDDSSGASSAVLHFRSLGVDRVMELSDDPTTLLLFIEAADQQNYHPDYLMSTVDQPELLAANLSTSDLPYFHGVGWLPPNDVAQPGGQGPEQARCLALLSRQGIHPQTQGDDATAETVCDPFFLYADLLAGTAGDATPGAALAGLARLGSGFSSAADLAGSTSFRSRHDGPATGRIFSYAASCSCLAYLGPRFPL